MNQSSTEKVVAQQVIDVINYLVLHRSTKTTQQMFYYFQKNNLEKHLVYAFPLMFKGEALAFETLLSQEVIKVANIEREELVNSDIILEMLEATSNRHN